MHRKELANTVTEPYTLAEAKAYARVEHVEDDILITTFLKTARALVESFCLLRLVEHKFQLSYDLVDLLEDADGCRVTDLILEDQTSILSIDTFQITQVIDEVNTPVAGIEDTDYFIYDNRLSVDLGSDNFSNEALRGRNTLVLTYTTDVEAMNQSFRDAMGMLISHWYENREAVQDTGSAGSMTEMTAGVASILAQYKHYSF